LQEKKGWPEATENYQRQASAAVTGLSAVSRAYDATTVAAISGTPGFSGVFAGDAVAPAGTPTGAFSDKYIASAKPVTVSGLPLSGADAGNYELSALTLSADITAAPLTVSGLSAVSRAYDVTTTAGMAGTRDRRVCLSGMM
jgi:hypothetical protein